MHGTLVTVIWVVLIIAAVIAAAALTSSKKTWEDYGKNHLLMERDLPPGPRAGAAASQERDEEIRQMLEARNARRIRRGEAPVDVEQELRRLTGKTTIDPQLRREIRELVNARNFRRARAGKPPLDVEAEVEREISRLSDVG